MRCESDILPKSVSLEDSDKASGFSGEGLEKLLADGRLERIGMGSRRACYRLPDGRHCLKCYRSEEEIAEGKYPGLNPPKPLAPGAAREIRRYRFDERHNSCCQEYRYWLELKKRLPADLMAIFPATMEQVYLPSRGWALVEELVLNADGSMPNKFIEEWVDSDAQRRHALLQDYDSLGRELSRSAVRFYDPPNIAVQRLANGPFRLRVTDFEPTSRLLVPIDRIPAFARFKVRRRFARHLRNWDIATQVSPQNSGRPISMSFCISDDFSQHVSVVLTSILVNNPGERFVFHLLHSGVSDGNRAKIGELERAYPFCKIEFHRVDAAIFEKLPLPSELEHVTREMYYRYLLPELLVDESRTIYSDVDVLCVGNLRPLWETNLGENVLAAVPDGKSGEDKKRHLGISGPSPYVCSGLLVMDLAKMREEGSSKRLFETTMQYAGRIGWPDQDVINIVFAGRISPLADVWNCTRNYSPFRRLVRQWHFQGFTQKPWCNIWKNTTWPVYLKYLLKSPYRANAVRFVWGHIRGFLYFKYTKKRVTRHLVCGILVWKRKEEA